MARSTSSETPVGHTRLFSALMWSIPVLFFALLELGLRVVGYGETLPLFVPIKGYESYLQPSDVVARRFFPSGQDSREPPPPPQAPVPSAPTVPGSSMN